MSDSVLDNSSPKVTLDLGSSEVIRAGHAGEVAGKTVLIVGAGTIGLLALACVKRKSPAKIIISDMSDIQLQTAKDMGADVTVNPGAENPREAVLTATGGKGADIVIEAVGAAQSVQQAMSALSFGGTAVWIGNNKQMVEINMQEIVTRELTAHGSFLYGYEEFQTVAALLNEGKLYVHPLISKEITLDVANSYFETLARNPGSLIKVVVSGVGK